MGIATVADLLSALRGLHQLPPEQLDILGREVLPADVRAVARTLVQRGWLTAYQVNQLFLGRGPQLLLGSYVLLDLLGEGGMGQVFKARNWKLGHIVAVKLIRKERLTNPDAVKRFQREILAAAQLDHPHIVRAYDADEVDGRHFFVMEYVEGTDLYKLVKTQGVLDVRRACDYVRQAALGLQHVHERGLVHRDIKPHNLLLVSGGVVSGAVVSGSSSATHHATSHHSLLTTHQIKILDMGLARIDAETDDGLSSTMTQQGTVMGTPDYLAPEQGIDAHAVDIRADLYSLGCTLYYLLAGRTPFAGGSFVEKLVKHRQQQATPLCQVRGDAPGAVDAVVAKLMAKRPDERFQTPAELAHVLETMQHASVTDITGGAPRRAPAPALPAGNAFAELGSNDAAPLVSELVRPTALPGAGDRRPLKLGLIAAAGGGLALILIIVTLRSLFGPGDPLSNAVRIVPQSKTKTASELAAAEEKRKQEEQQQREQAEAEFQKKRQREGEGPLAELELKAAKQKMAFAELAREVQEFNAKYGGTPASVKAAELLMKLPSPLDQLDPAKLPQDAVDAWRAMGSEPPKELVGVLGEHGPRHGAGVVRVAYAADGRSFASAGSDGMVKLWQAAPRKELRSIRAHPDGITAMAFRPGGKILATSAHGGGTRLWDVNTGKMIHEPFGGHAGTTALAFSGDGKLLATGGSGDHAIHVWEVDSRKLLRTLTGHVSWVSALAFPTKGSILASGSRDGTIRLWDTTSGKELRTLVKHAPNNHDWVLAFSGDGQKLAAAGPFAIPLSLWNVTTGAALGSFPGVVTVAFGDGDQFVSRSHNDIKIWDLSTGKERLTIKNVSCASVAWSPDGRRLVSGHADGTVRLWDRATGQEIQPPAEQDVPLTHIALAPDAGRLLVGRFTAAYGNVLQVWDVALGRQLFRIQGKADAAQTDNASVAVFTLDGKALAVGETNGNVRLRDVLTGAPLRFAAGLENAVTSLDISADGQLLAAGCGYAGNAAVPGTVKVWNLATGREHGPVLTHKTLVASVAFSPDGSRLASFSQDGELRFWRAHDGKYLDMLSGLGGPGTHVSFLPQGKSVVAGAPGEPATTWDIVSHRESPFANGVKGIWPGRITGDGKTAVTAAGDRIVIWTIASGDKLREWQLPGPVHAIALAADGRHLATANGNGTVYLLRLSPRPRNP
jgi:serine/threonine-protein kinase